MRYRARRRACTATDFSQPRRNLDFVNNQLATYRRFGVLNIVDDMTRHCPPAGIDTSISGRWVARELDDLIAGRDAVKMIVSDNGTELTSSTVSAWFGEVGIEWHHIAPGKPAQKGPLESLDASMRDELLNEALLYTIGKCLSIPRQLD